MTGQILCRLLPESRDVRELGKFLKEKAQHGGEPYFMIQEKHRGQHAAQVTMSFDVIERMIRQSQFNLGKITVHLSSKLSESEMFLCFNDGEAYSISRFPRSLFQDDSAREFKSLSVHGNIV